MGERLSRWLSLNLWFEICGAICGLFVCGLGVGTASFDENPDRTLADHIIS